MKKDQSYFNSPAIGSSLLADFIKSPDHALKKVSLSLPMLYGIIWEDMLEAQLKGNADGFYKKFYHSKIDKFPDTKNPTLTNIVELLNSPDITQALNSAYIYKNDGSLSNTYKNRHFLLDEIKDNNYRIPIPSELWEIFNKQWINFQKAVYWKNKLTDWLTKTEKVVFQQPYFWTDEDTGAECRMKSDIEVYYEHSGEKSAQIFDIKWTSCYDNFRRGWSQRYIWQNAHYINGFHHQCAQNNSDIALNPNMVFIVSEAKEPYMTYVIELSLEAKEKLEYEYKAHLGKCWEWIQNGRRSQGYLTQTVDRYLRPITL